MRRVFSMAEFQLESERLILREWRDNDVDAFHAIRQDPRVMATLGPLQSKEEVSETIKRMQKMQSEFGHCFWVVEHKNDRCLIGWCGVMHHTAKNRIRHIIHRRKYAYKRV